MFVKTLEVIFSCANLRNKYYVNTVAANYKIKF
jgi:hypothetical protein